MIALLDVNVLFVLHQPLHPDFMRVNRWFLQTTHRRFATCPMTQSGMIRLLVQGIAGLDPFNPQEAREALQDFVHMPNHVFWPDAPPWLECTQPLFNRLQGHRQTTDAYLLGLAIHNKGKLATLDHGIPHLAGPQFAANVELIEP
jgi:hypothetical protein